MLFRIWTTKDTEIRPFPNALRDPPTVAAMIGVYREVFGADPWNEWKQCPLCDASFGRYHRGNVCTACHGKRILLVEYWSRDRVAKKLYSELAKVGAECLLSYADEGVCGFAWGYEIDIDEVFARHIEAQHLYHAYPDRNCFYVSEVGVLRNYRKQGVGRRLFDGLIEPNLHRLIVLRTLEGSPMFKLVTSEGFKVAERLNDGRVIMALEPDETAKAAQ